MSPSPECIGWETLKKKLQNILKCSETFNLYLFTLKGSNYILKYGLKS